METLRRTVRETRVAVIVALIISLVSSGTSLYVAGRDSGHARQLAADARTLARNAALNASAKRRILHATDVRSCARDHRFAVTFTRFLRESTARSEKLLATPGALRNLSPTLVANARESVLKAKALRVQLEMADCDPNDPRDVLPLKEGP